MESALCSSPDVQEGRAMKETSNSIRGSKNDTGEQKTYVGDIVSPKSNQVALSIGLINRSFTCKSSSGDEGARCPYLAKEVV